MKKFTTKQGYIAYACTAQETTYLGGLGICDDCGKAAPNGFLVPVLNRYMCPDCFKEWQTAEAKNAAYYEYRIPMDKEEN